MVVTPPEVTVKTPSTPEVLLTPVCPTNPVARPRNVRLDTETISTLSLDRSAIKIFPVTGSARLMSNEVNTPPGARLKSLPLPISAAVLDFRATEQDAITPKSFTDNRRHRRFCGEPKTTANSSQDGQARCGSADCESLGPNWSIVG